MFEGIRQSLRDAMNRASSPAEGRVVLSQMRAALVDAKAALAEVREAMDTTRRRLAVEREQLETARRRGKLAADIGDEETVRVATEYERKHAERVAVLERKITAQESEYALAEREVAEMSEQFKRASLTGGVSSSTISAPVSDEELMGGPSTDAGSDDLRRQMDRAVRESAAEQQLAELKRRMGR